ncbi:MAG: HAD family phosphatase [Phycisphaerales bacterium]|nr:MAG: HAD family phosphatase [Phycisphaerales bacterium]
MKDRFEVLVVDLDGTLMTGRGKVSPRNRGAIEAARQAGMTLIVATGRALVESLEPLEAIQHRGLLIGAGGALLSDVATGRTVARNTMPPDLVADVTAALLRHEHKVLILKDPDEAGYDYLAVGPGELDPASRWWFEVLPVRVRFVHALDQDPHPQASVRVGAVATEEELAPIATQLQAEISERGFLQHWSAVTESAAVDSATHLLEVFSPDVNKWTMVAEYCRRNEIDPQRVLAIGDGVNDVQLVGNAGLGIAMANADAPVLEAADRVTGHHDEDGLADAIERVLDGRW